MAPTPARAKGTTAPTATNFDSTATPRSFVFGSKPTMLKVEDQSGRIGRDIGLQLIPLPARLKRNPQLRRCVHVRPLGPLWCPPGSREDVPRISGPAGGSPRRTVRRFARCVAAGA